MATHTLACPGCGSTDELATIEEVTGLAPLGALTRTDGKLKLDIEGPTEMDWDSSTTVGVHCKACGYDDESKNWAAAMIDVPDVPTQICLVLDKIDEHEDENGEPADPWFGLDDECLERILARQLPPAGDRRAVLLIELLTRISPPANGWYPNRFSDLYEEILERLPAVNATLA